MQERFIDDVDEGGGCCCYMDDFALLYL